jgi:hypothetical protein
MNNIVRLCKIIITFSMLVLFSLLISTHGKVEASAPLYKQYIGGTYYSNLHSMYVPNSGGFADMPSPYMSYVTLSPTTYMEIVSFDKNYSTTQAKLRIRFGGTTGSVLSSTLPSKSYLEYFLRIQLLDRNGVSFYTDSNAGIINNYGYFTELEYDIFFDKTKRLDKINLHHSISASSLREYYSGPWNFTNGSSGVHSGSVIYTTFTFTTSNNVVINLPNLYNKPPVLSLTTQDNQLLAAETGLNKYKVEGFVSDPDGDTLSITAEIG